MANLFGLDIAGIINTEIAAAGGLVAGTLTKTSAGTRTGGALTAGTNPVTTVHAISGFVEKRTRRFEGQLIADVMTVVTILGASVSPAAVPEVNDSVTLDGADHVLTALLSRDPASAIYEFQAASS